MQEKYQLLLHQEPLPPILRHSKYDQDDDPENEYAMRMIDKSKK